MSNFQKKKKKKKKKKKMSLKSQLNTFVQTIMLDHDNSQKRNV